MHEVHILLYLVLYKLTVHTIIVEHGLSLNFMWAKTCYSINAKTLYIKWCLPRPKKEKNGLYTLTEFFSISI